MFWGEKAGRPLATNLEVTNNWLTKLNVLVALVIQSLIAISGPDRSLQKLAQIQGSVSQGVQVCG